MNHGDETYLQFHPYGSNMWPNEKFTNADQAVSDTVVELWKNFAKTGNPSSEGTFYYVPILYLYKEQTNIYFVITALILQISFGTPLRIK